MWDLAPAWMRGDFWRSGGCQRSLDVSRVATIVGSFYSKNCQDDLSPSFPGAVEV